MCGLIGSLRVAGAPGAWPAASETRLRFDEALASIAHRGPDGEGQWWSEDGSVGLGHRRLALVDLEGGAQPLVHAGSRPIVAVVNGELYDEGGRLRAQLEAKGHRFATRSDSELLVHLYREHGLTCVDHLRGEFAFLLWDAQEGQLVAARDRFGIKPLVFARFGGGLHFASETKALFELGLARRWDEACLAAAFSQQSLPLGKTLFAGVEELPPGHLLIATREELKIRRYWDLDLPAEPEAAADERELIEEFRRRLAVSVALRRRGDTPVAYCLSGGVDSNSVLALGADDARSPLDAFTLSFEDADYDELALAEQGAAAQCARLHCITVSPLDVLDQLDDAVQHGEGLTINGQLSAKFMLSRALCEAGYKVALTGEGSDEMLMGYAHLRRDLLGEDASATLLEGNRVSAGLMLPSREAELAPELESAHTRLGHVPSYLRAKEEMTRPLRALLRADLRSPKSAGDRLAALLARVPSDQIEGRPPHRQGQYLWSRHVLAGYILRTLGDGSEMANGVEGRPPFLDHELFEFCRDLPAGMLLREGRDKFILREAMREQVPSSILDREKHPFLLPPLSALREPRVRDALQARLHAASRLPIVDSDAVRRFARDLTGFEGDTARPLDPSIMLLISAEALGRRLRLSA